ncbi:hypothetical protein [Rhizobium sp. Leaf391]|uniref:hypothetical protein n=1 Tax=Rhizobium sp. Leaf391 TaxID=1736360 RepID=UPI000A6D575F|nr:hypothetical protein [Rhizobium sp. Leaf391]
MTDEPELQARFWKALKSDMTVMLGLAGVDEDGHPRIWSPNKALRHPVPFF